MSSLPYALAGTPTIYAQVDYGATFGRVYRPLNRFRTATAAGNVTVQAHDYLILIKKTIPAPTTVLLPDLARWMRLPIGGFPVVIKDGANNAGTYNITILPFGTQTIDLLPGFTIAGDGGALMLFPMGNMTGWLTL